MPKPAPNPNEWAHWPAYRAGAAACMKHMSEEGRANAVAFWTRHPPKQPPKAK